MSEPDRLSEGVDSFIDESFAYRKRACRSNGLLTFVVHFFKNKEEEVVWEGKEGSGRFGELNSCSQRAGVVSLSSNRAQDSSTYLQ